MLILTRKIDQNIIINGDIIIRILGVEKDRVKIGIEAPKDISVLREELTQKYRKPGVIASFKMFKDRNKIVSRRILA